MSADAIPAAATADGAAITFPTRTRPKSATAFAATRTLGWRAMLRAR